jgi:hypothetical protein
MEEQKIRDFNRAAFILTPRSGPITLTGLARASTGNLTAKKGAHAT